MKSLFKDDPFAFESVRYLSVMYYGGSDLGEMMATASKITKGDSESWFTEWYKLARRLVVRADASLNDGHPESAMEDYLRASTYFRTAEFYLNGNPADPRILSTSNASQKAYAKAAKLSVPVWEQVKIPYGVTTLPGYFYKVDNSGKPRPTLIIHGGYDSSVEELGFFGGMAAVWHGYNCLTFEGPGQGMTIREEKLTFRFDWEAVVTPVIDYALTRSDVDGESLALMGMNMGGFLAARAVAFEHRIKAAIFFDGVYDLNQGLHNMPKDALAARDMGDIYKFEEIMKLAMENVAGLRWFFNQGVWTFGASSISDFMEKIKPATLEGIAGRIKCPCLVLEGDGDMFFPGQPEQIYHALKCQKTYFRFMSAGIADTHRQSGSLSYFHEVAFNWLDVTLGKKRK